MIWWYGGVDVLCFIIQGEGMYTKVEVSEAKKVCHEVLPVSWRGGDKSATRVEAKGIHFRLNAVYIETSFRERECKNIAGC